MKEAMKQKIRMFLSAILCTVCIIGGMDFCPVTVYADTAGTENVSETVHVYADTPGDVKSSKYTLTANGTDIPVIKYSANGNNFDIARFSSDDASPEYNVTVNEEIKTVKVYPERYYPQDSIKIGADKRSLTFTMSESLRYAIVMINGSPADQAGKPYLAIINDPTENEADKPNPNTENVLNFKTFMEEYLNEHPNSETQKAEEAGTTSGGISYEAGELVDNSTSYVTFPNKRKMAESDATYALQAALDEIYKEGSVYDTLYIPEGEYTWSGLDIRNRNGKEVLIYVEEGALLKNRIQECTQAMEPAIGIWDSSDITISGRGIFDGNGVANYRKDRHDAKDSCHQGGVMIVRSSNIVFNDTYVRDAKQWNWESHGSKYCTLNNVKGLTPYNQPWVDGLDMASAQNLTINGAFTLGNDDCFASGHYNPSDGFTNTVPGFDQYNEDSLEWDTEDSFNVNVSNTLGWSFGGGNGIRLGHNTYGHQMKNYSFNNLNALNFTGGDLGITVQNNQTTTKPYPKYESLTFENCSFDTTRVGANAGINGVAGEEIPEVSLKNCWFSNPDADIYVNNIKKLTITDLYIGGEKVKYGNEANLTESNVTEFIHDWEDNHLPEFISLDDRITATAGETLELEIQTSDADGDAVTLGIKEDSELPDGAEFDAAAGKFTWTPGEESVGSYEITFTASDGKQASEKKVSIEVKSANYTVVDVKASADATVQSWKTDKTANYGSNDFIKTSRMKSVVDGNTSLGLVGELIGNSTSDTNDAKIALLKFDASMLKSKLQKVDRAVLELTYIGRRNNFNGNISGEDTVMAMQLAGDWNENEVTWNGIFGGKTINFGDGKVKESAAFTVEENGNVKMENSYQASSQAVDGRKIAIDITEFIQDLSQEEDTLSIAVCDKNGWELSFVSKEGAANSGMANSTEDMAPVIHFYVENEPEVTEIQVTPPTVTDYAAGNEMDLTGMTVTANYVDGTTADVTEAVLADKEAVKGFDSSKTGKQTITITYGGKSKTVDITVWEKSGNWNISADTTVQSWDDKERSTWYGDKDYLRTQCYTGADRGIFGEKITATDSKKDAKISLLKFDVSKLPNDIDTGKAVLELTYIARKRAETEGGDEILAAVIPSSGISTWSWDDVTWNNVFGEGTVSIEENHIKSSETFAIVSDNGLLMASSDDKYNAKTQGVDGRKIKIDITDFVKNLGDDTELVLAVCDTKGIELAFVSSEGALNMANADTDMAPVIRLYGSKADGDENEKELKGITITPPNKTGYKIGEEADWDGMKVTAEYSDGTTGDVTQTVLENQETAITGFETETSGEKTITVSYEGMVQTFKINVTNEAEVDKTALKKSIASAETLKEADYTTESWGVLQAALAVAKKVVNKTDATQNEVDEAKKVLDTAVAGMKKNDNAVRNPDNSADSNTTQTSDNNTDNSTVPESGKVKVSKISFNNKGYKIAAGKKVQLKPIITPGNAGNKKVIWSTSNKKYATVSSKGVVTTKKAGAGKAVTITAKAADGSKVQAKVKIQIMKNAVTKITLKTGNKTVKAGKKVVIKSTVKTNGRKVNKTLEWSTSNSKYATVNKKGVVTTKKAGAGKTVTITAKSTDGTNKKASIKIKLKK